MMKLRCKLRDASNTSQIVGSQTVQLSDTASLKDLLCAVAALYGLTPAEIEISQNGRDPLTAAPDSTAEIVSVRSLGLVPGDLIYIHCLTTSKPQVSPSSKASPEAAAAAPAPAAAVVVPILVGEVPDRGIRQLCPSLQLMQRLYNSSNDQLLQFTLAIHCLMVETGFLSIEPGTGRTHQEILASDVDPAVLANRVLTRYLLPRDFSSESATDRVSYTINYSYSLTHVNGNEWLRQSPRIRLKVLRSGKLAMCHCAVWRPGSEEAAMLCCHSWHCNLNRFVPNRARKSSSTAAAAAAGGYESLRQLSVLFKDSIAERAKAAIHEICGLPLLGLTGLPTELVLRIMRSCHNARTVCSLGAACRRLQMLHSDNYIWRSMLVRDYGTGSERVAQYLDAERQGLEVNYYEAYRVFHEERVKRHRMLARLTSRELAPLTPWQDMPGVLPPFFLGAAQPPPLLLQPEQPEAPVWPRPLQYFAPDDI